MHTSQHSTCKKTYYNLGFVLGFRELPDQNLKKASYFREEEKKPNQTKHPKPVLFLVAYSLYEITCKQNTCMGPCATSAN